MPVKITPKSFSGQCSLIKSVWYLLQSSTGAFLACMASFKRGRGMENLSTRVVSRSYSLPLPFRTPATQARAFFAWGKTLGDSSLFHTFQLYRNWYHTSFFRTPMLWHFCFDSAAEIFRACHPHSNLYHVEKRRTGA